MRHTVALIALFALLVACGTDAPAPEEDAPPQTDRQRPSEQPPAPPPEEEPEPEPEPPESPFADVPEADIEINPNWLVIKGEMGEQGPLLSIGDGEKYSRHHLWNITDAIVEYLRRRDPDAGLPGIATVQVPYGEYRVSRNPIIFQCPANTSSTVLEVFKERMRSEANIGEWIFAMTHADGVHYARYSVQGDPRPFLMPPAPTLPPEAETTFPDDDDDPTDSQPEEEDSEMAKFRAEMEAAKAERDRMTLELLPVYDRNKEVFGFRTVRAGEALSHRPTGFRPLHICNEDEEFSAETYRRVRMRVAEAMLERLNEEGGDAVRVVDLNFTGECVSATNAPEDNSVPWLTVVMQFDALRMLNDIRQPEAPQLIPELKRRRR